MSMTDEQIIEALELESKPSEMNCIYANYIEGCGIYCDKKKCNAENCAGCKEHRMAYCGTRAKAILSLIKRQQAEIERLKQEATELQLRKEMYRVTVDEVRAEAVREFAERLKDIYAAHDGLQMTIDNLVKEMTEEKE